MHISIIVVIDKKGGIGFSGDQLAYISGDLKRFKQLTTGHPIVMGRKTYESLPNGALPNRRNIVLTRNPQLTCNGCEMARTIEDVLDKCRKEQELFVIGGGEVYDIFMPVATRIYFTHIHHKFDDVDTWFPEIKRDDWNSVMMEGPFTDPKTNLQFSYETVERK
ncbi:dihydrofolate reductase [Alkalitalea saponilacus]|uniref:Dihydrofolate reductase n=1 Tax=Alkalitalea saponilacus TaxID=889453 RepID=A0A1T5A299_9BACT|nr:dihydrofolate reductase [Alkalitalea saponilacus]ASB48892.1 dihydrofolate reductase [Alkalitalea saponilacus]SKB29141.1 dihydrofolate reductase [Alkalitalea saponilacus]